MVRVPLSAWLVLVDTNAVNGFNVSEKLQQELDEKRKQERIKLLSRVVCICKGIPLGKVLPALDDSETVADVNRKTGCGSGGCQGQRCGPRIKALLRKKKEAAKD